MFHIKPALAWALATVGLVLLPVCVRCQEAEHITTGMPGVVIRPSDNARLPVNVGSIDIEDKSVKVQQGETVSDLLDKNGINSTVASLSVVYELNPSLASVDKLTPGDTLVVPSVADPATINYDKGYRVTFFADPRPRGDLYATKMELHDLAVTLETGPEFASKSQVLELIENSLESLKVLGSPRAIVSEEMLLQVSAETALIRDLAEEAIKHTELGADKLKQLDRATSDLNNKRQNVSAGKNPHVLVSVRTLKDGKVEKDGYRIVYAAIALRSNPLQHKRFRKLSSPAEQDVPNGIYHFWAEKADAIASEELEVEVETPSNGSALRVDLRLNNQ